MLGNMERAMKHFTVGASAGDYNAMHRLNALFSTRGCHRESIDSTLAQLPIILVSRCKAKPDSFIRIKKATNDNTQQK